MCLVVQTYHFCLVILWLSRRHTSRIFDTVGDWRVTNIQWRAWKPSVPFGTPLACRKLSTRHYKDWLVSWMSLGSINSNRQFSILFTKENCSWSLNRTKLTFSSLRLLNIHVMCGVSINFTRLLADVSVWFDLSKVKSKLLWNKSVCAYETFTLRSLWTVPSHNSV